MSFHCVLILIIFIEQSAISLTAAPLKQCDLFPFGYFKIFRFIACFHKFHYVVCRCGFLYINLTWVSFSFLCFLSLWIAIFFISLKNPWSLSSNIAFAYYLFLGFKLEEMIESHVSHSVLFSPFLFLSVLQLVYFSTELSLSSLLLVTCFC